MLTEATTLDPTGLADSTAAEPATSPGTAPARTVGALVIGGDYQGLGIVRSIGRAGWPTFVVDDERSIARFSRHAVGHLRAPDLRSEEATIETLLEAARRFDLFGWTLFPTREETVAAVSRHRGTLSEVFRVPTPSWESIRFAWDKRNTYTLAAELGIPCPRTWYPRRADDLDAIDVEGPFALKPAVKERFLYATGAKAWRADSRADLPRLLERAAALIGDGELMVQELIPGDGREQLAHCSFFKNGESLATMTVRRWRQHPPEFGRASTYVETIELPELAEAAERFLRAIDYYGLVELEFKRDTRDGIYKLLDVNARTWGYHSLGPAAGVDFPALVMADLLGATIAPRRARTGVRWVRLATDVPTAVVEIARRRLSLVEYLRSLRAADTEAVFSARDPLPGLAEIVLLPYLAAKRGF